MPQGLSELDILLSELKDMRDEVKTRVEQRNYMTEVMVVLVAALIGGAATAHVFFVIGIAPFIAIFFLLLIKASYNRHRYLIEHIRLVEERINSILLFSGSSGVTYWETWFRETQKTNRRNIYNAFNVGTAIVCSAFFTWGLFIGDSLTSGPFEWLQHYFLVILVVYYVGVVSAVTLSFIRKGDIEDKEEIIGPIPDNGWLRFRYSIRKLRWIRNFL